MIHKEGSSRLLHVLLIPIFYPSLFFTNQTDTLILIFLLMDKYDDL